MRHWPSFMLLWALLGAPALAAPGRLGGGGGLTVSLNRLILSLLFCLGLAVIAAVLLKRSGGRLELPRWRPAATGLALKPPVRRLQVIESRRISPHADLCLVRCDDRDYLILSSAAQQQVIHTMERAP